jgi:hypothetical protein
MKQKPDGIEPGIGAGAAGPHAERRLSACVVEIIPVGAFRTFGVGVPLRAMLNPAAAQARVPVAPDERVR